MKYGMTGIVENEVEDVSNCREWSRRCQ